MRLLLSQELFDGEHNRKLTVLLDKCLEEKLYLELDSEVRIDKWLSALSNKELHEWQLALDLSELDAGRFQSVNVIRVMANNNTSCWNEDIPSITINEAVSISGLPFKLVLENSRSDRSFWLCSANYQLRKRILDLEKKGMLEFVNGGGIGELKKQFEEIYIKDIGYPARYWILFDSDSPRPHCPSDEAESIITLCEQYGVQYYCLERRAIENYVPLECRIKQIPEQAKATSREFKMLNAFKSMTQEQKNHFHMKKGLNDYTCQKSGLYDNLNEDTINLIGNGFGKDFANTFKQREDNIEEYEIVHQRMKEEGSIKELINPCLKIQKFIRIP